MTRPRVLMFEPFPIPYFAPLHRALFDRDDIEIHVVYETVATADATHFDHGFGTTLKWDVPLLDGYPWSLVSDLRGARQLLKEADVVFLSTYRTPRAITVWLQALLMRLPVVFGSDAVDLEPQPDARVRWLPLRRVVARTLARLAGGINATSARAVRFNRELATRDPDKVTFVPYVADPAVFRPLSMDERVGARRRLGIPDQAFVVGFVGKLIDRKRPADLLMAIAETTDCVGLVVGSGPLQEDLKRVAAESQNPVVFVGFKNQSELPEMYSAMDVLVLPSSQEPFGLVLHEASLCGAVGVCTRECGAFDDLVAPVAEWLGYGSGDIAALSAILRRLQACEQLSELKSRALDVAQARSVKSQADAFVTACLRAMRSVRHRNPNP